MDSRSEQIFGIYYDGKLADPRDVSFFVNTIEPAGIDPRDELRYNSNIEIFIQIVDIELDHEIAHWEYGDIYPVHSRKGELRLASEGALPGARLVISNPNMARITRNNLPQIAHHKRKQRAKTTGVVGLVTLAMASVIVAYIFGIPLLADRIVTLVPYQTEIEFGDKIVAQLDSAFAEQGGLTLCDADPNSVANVAIKRFAEAALEGVDTPFDVDIQVVANSIPNAFALPGGHSYYFAGLLEQTRSPDEFAGVMAHEIGHVVHRHGMEQLISNAGTGLLVGFVLGDITGLSIAGGVGSALINSSFSRDAEREADEFSFQVASRLNFDTSGLPDLLDRIGEDDEGTLAFALLSTHPLNQERRAALQAREQNEALRVPAFSASEWQAISSMCQTRKGPKTKTK